MSKVTAYLRVSQDDQDVKNQKFGILGYANKLGLTNVVFTEDVVTSRTNWKMRKIGEIISNLEAGDILLVAETTRLGRSALEVLEMQKDILEKGAILHIVKENLVIGNTGQTEIERITQKMMLSLFGHISEMERAFISKRTKEALAKKKAEGVVLGRPKGVETVWTLDRKYIMMFTLMKKGISVDQMLKIVADEGEKPMMNKVFYDWTRRWGIEPIGYHSKCDEATIQRYFKQIEDARPRIKALLERMDKKKHAAKPNHRGENEIPTQQR